LTRPTYEYGTRDTTLLYCSISTVSYL
jgi:hypothetical protein